MAQSFSPEVSQLVSQYNLGIPVKQYTHQGRIILWICILGMCLLAAIAMPLPLFSSNLSLILGSCMELIFLCGIVISVALVLVYLPYSAYECTEGFIEFTRKKGKLEVKQFLRWDNITGMHVISRRGSRGASYYVIDRSGRHISVGFSALWRACRRVFKQRTGRDVEHIVKK